MSWKSCKDNGVSEPDKGDEHSNLDSPCGSTWDDSQRRVHETSAGGCHVLSELTEAGIPAEDARAVLPNAASTSIVASLNLREMIHLANLRLCTRAQYEIRSMIKMMCDELIKEEAWLKPYLVPKCERLGYCDEDKSCGRMPKLGQ